jgi:protein-tyrosine phosphatase
MRRIYQERGLAGIIESAGTLNWSAGRPADPTAGRIAMENGISVAGHRARQIRRDDFDRFDLIVVMDTDNFRAVSEIAPEAMRSKIRRLLKSHDGQGGDVPDPYLGDEEFFRSTFHLIHHGCAVLADDLPALQRRAEAD